MRRSIWIAGLEIFSQKPLLGVGLGTFQHQSPQVITSTLAGKEMSMHNTFLGILVELGVIGLGIFFSLLFFLIMRLRYMPSSTRIFWVILLLTWTIGALAQNWLFMKGTWLLLGLLATQASFFEGNNSTFRMPA